MILSSKQVAAVRERAFEEECGAVGGIKWEEVQSLCESHEALRTLLEEAGKALEQIQATGTQVIPTRGLGAWNNEWTNETVMNKEAEIAKAVITRIRQAQGEKG